MKWSALIVAALLALGATACDEGSESEGSEAESAATAAEGEGAAAEETADEESAEEGSGKDRLVGTWVLDEKTVKEMMEDAKAEKGKNKAAKGLGAAMIMAMKPKFEFKADGTSVFTMNNPMKEDAEPKKEEAEWEVLSEDGDTLTIKTVDSKGEEEELTATFDGDDRVTIAKEGDKMKMHLKRES